MSAAGFLVLAAGLLLLWEARGLLTSKMAASNATTAPATGGGSLGPTTTPAGDVGSWIDAAIAQTGVEAATWRGRLASLVGTESGGSPTALNPLHVFSNGVAPSSDPNVIAANAQWDAGQASGVMQTLPGTFRQYADPGASIWDPIANLVAAIRYIQHRYAGGINDPELIRTEAAGIGY